MSSAGNARAVLLGIAAFVLACGIRLGNAPDAFAGGLPVISPLDELYHWKRVTFAATHFPSSLDFDVDRGLRGAFCPWPPLYDFALATVAVAAGASDAYGVLRVITWIPPLVSALLIAIAVAVLARKRGTSAALLIVPLATAPILVLPSSIGEIDHHWLEPFLALSIAAATLALLGPEPRRRTLAAFALFASICAAMFVQTALIVAAALALFAVAVAGKRRESFFAAAAAFAASAATIGVYRLTRPPGYPDSAWFLGTVHAAALAGAAVASAILGWLATDRRRIAATAAALLAGALTIAAIPGAAASIAHGATFFHGDPWLDSILEFRPIWRPLHDVTAFAIALALGAVAGVALLIRRRTAAAVVTGIFATAYIALTLSSRRFAGIATLAAAIAAWLLILELREDGRRTLAAIAVVALVAVPPLQLLSAWPSGGSELSGNVLRFFRATNWLRDHGRPGRVLAPWSYGHMLDVIGKRPVIIDNFGTMPGEEPFRLAYSALVAHDDPAVARFADRYGIAYVIIESPPVAIGSYVHFLSLPVESFVRADTATTYTLRSWCWRAFFPFLPPPEGFRRVYSDGALVILERDATPARVPSPTATLRGPRR